MIKGWLKYGALKISAYIVFKFELEFDCRRKSHKTSNLISDEMFRISQNVGTSNKYKIQIQS